MHFLVISNFKKSFKDAGIHVYDPAPDLRVQYTVCI